MDNLQVETLLNVVSLPSVAFRRLNLAAPFADATTIMKGLLLSPSSGAATWMMTVCRGSVSDLVIFPFAHSVSLVVYDSKFNSGSSSVSTSSLYAWILHRGWPCPKRCAEAHY
jgi:hypothetical protein